MKRKGAASLILILILVANTPIQRRVRAQTLENRDFDIGSKLEAELNKTTGELIVSKWNNEVTLKIKMPVDPVSADTISEKERLVYEQYTVEVYEVSTGIEYEVIYNERPESNIIVFRIESKGLAFYYQPALNDLIWPKGYTVNETHVFDDNGTLEHYRPVEIVGSYQIYHESKRNNQYGTGKVGPIYRPLVYDSKGDSIWAELYIDAESGIMTITIPDSWLDSALYPIYIDPTFGKTDVGGSSAHWSADYTYETSFSLSEEGTITDIHIYNADATPEGNVNAGIYNDSAGAADNLVVGPTGQQAVVTGWNNFTGLSTLLAADTYHIAGFFTITNLDGRRYDSGPAGSSGYDDAELADPFQEDGALSYIQSMFATYTVDGAGNYPVIEDITPTTTAGTTHTISYPTTVDANDLLIAMFACDDDEASVTFPNEGTEWYEIYFEDAGTQGPTLAVAWKEAVGDEDGTTFNITTPTSEGSATFVFRITNMEDPDTQPPEVSVSNSSSNNLYPDPIGLSPTGGSKDYLWIAVAANDDDDSYSAYPSNMGVLNQEAQETTVTLGISTVNSTTATFEPLQFTLAAAEQWEAMTIAVHPIGGTNYERDVTQALTMTFNAYRPTWSLTRAVSLSQTFTWTQNRGAWSTGRLSSISLSTVFNGLREWVLLRSLTQSLSFSWDSLRDWSIARSLSLSLSATWNALSEWSLLRTATQAITTTFDAIRSWTLSRTATQGLTFTWDAIGQISAVQEYLREITLSLTHTWNSIRIWDASREITQALTFTWTPFREWNVIRSLTQSLSFSWDSLREWSIIRPLSLSLTTTWNALREWSLLRVIEQSLTTSFDAIRSWTVSRTITQGFTFVWDAFGEIISGNVYTRTVTLSLTHTVNAIKGAWTLTRTAIQSLTTTFETFREWSLLRELSQGFTFTWDAIGNLFHSYTRTVTLGLTFTWDAIGSWIADLPGSLLDVLVTTLDGEAILNAVVSVWNLDNGNLIFTELTNSTGYIPRQNMTEGNYTITGQADNYLQNMLKFNISVDRSLSLVLTHAEDAIMIPLPFFGFIMLACASLYIGWKQPSPTNSLWAYFFSLVFWIATMYQWNIDNGTSNPAMLWVFMFPILTLVFFIYEEATKYYEESMQGYKNDPFG